MDVYANYQQLQRSEVINQDFRILWREGSSGIAILSIHGGEIEPGTTQLADMIVSERKVNFQSIETAHRDGK